MENTPRIGALLVQENVINEAQLEEVLTIQKKHPYLTVGEIASKQFNIPEEYIETVFAEEILLKTFKRWLLSELSKKMKGLDVGKVVEAVQVTINEFTRISLAQKIYERNNKGIFAPSSEKEYLSKINCCAKKIVLKTKMGKNIAFHEFNFEYDEQSQRIALENESLLIEAKIKVMQLLKKSRSAL